VVEIENLEQRHRSRPDLAFLLVMARRTEDGVGEHLPAAEVPGRHDVLEHAQVRKEADVLKRRAMPRRVISYGLRPLMRAPSKSISPSVAS
jgi:hypothetical protein